MARDRDPELARLGQELDAAKESKQAACKLESAAWECYQSVKQRHGGRLDWLKADWERERALQDEAHEEVQRCYANGDHDTIPYWKTKRSEHAELMRRSGAERMQLIAEINEAKARHAEAKAKHDAKRTELNAVRDRFNARLNELKAQNEHERRERAFMEKYRPATGLRKDGKPGHWWDFGGLRGRDQTQRLPDGRVKHYRHEGRLIKGWIYDPKTNTSEWFEERGKRS